MAQLSFDFGRARPKRKMAARKYPKKPKMPKASASLAVWEGFQDRLKEWRKKCAAIDAAKAQKEADKKKKATLIKKMRDEVRKPHKARK